MAAIPHPIPYQGSKRKLAPSIYSFTEQKKYDTLYEPFSGSAAFTLYAASHDLARKYVISDSLEPLIELWKMIINHPEETVKIYTSIWEGQKDGDLEYFNGVREKFNSNRDPVHLLYLMVRCVKNAIRFNNSGNFSQSADKRRKGTRPATMEKQVLGASRLLKGRVEFFTGDFRKVLEPASSNDLIYMDPPYQGTSQTADKRYYEQLTNSDLSIFLKDLNKRDIDYLLSYDGKTGDKKHGQDLPDHLGLSRVYINAGRSSQATLTGLDAVTLESLYFSPTLSKQLELNNDEIFLHNGQRGLDL